MSLFYTFIKYFKGGKRPPKKDKNECKIFRPHFKHRWAGLTNLSGNRVNPTALLPRQHGSAQPAGLFINLLALIIVDSHSLVYSNSDHQKIWYDVIRYSNNLG